MANRSYLFSCDTLPELEKQSIVGTGISEWNYALPLVFKLLLSGNPRVCASAIWETSDVIGIAGEYDAGMNALNAFFEQLRPLHPDAPALIDEARAFLTNSAQKRRYFLLECGELYVMTDEDLETQNQRTLEEIKQVDVEVAQVLALLRPSVPQENPLSFLSRLLRPKPAPVSATVDTKELYNLGFGNWSNVLYFGLNTA